MTVFLKTFFENKKSIFSHKPFYDKQKDWQRIASQVSTSVAIQNPFTFYYVQDGDWSSSHNYNYWNKNFTNAVSITNVATLKTIYDPSISGFALPRTAAFTNLTSSGNNSSNSGEFNVSGSFTKGWNFYTNGWKAGNTIFFEAFGFRDIYSGRSTGTGALTFVSGVAFYWLSGAYSASGARNFYFEPSFNFPQDWRHRSYGNTVRPAKE